nr:AraC family transcriptional regulator [Steroidobacter gossypii]
MHGSNLDSLAAPSLIREEMSYWLLQPTPLLRAEVKSYYVVDVAARAMDKHELHMPDGYAELVFVFGEGYQRADLEPAAAAANMRRSYVIGGRSRSIVTCDRGRIRVIGVKLEPRSLRGLLRSPLTDYRDCTVELPDLNDRRLLALEDQLANCADPHEIAVALDRFLLARHATMNERDPIIEHLMHRIRAEYGGTLLTQAARDYGIDPRTLERRFIAWSGMSAKSYCRIVRFKLAYHAFLQRCSGCVRDADPLRGYYDQSHFIREFRFFTGTSPRQVAAQRTSASTDVTNLLLARDVSAASGAGPVRNAARL